MDVGVIAFVCLSTRGKSPFGIQFNFLLFCVNTWVSVANFVHHWTFYLDPEEILNSRSNLETQETKMQNAGVPIIMLHLSTVLLAKHFSLLC